MHVPLLVLTLSRVSTLLVIYVTFLYQLHEFRSFVLNVFHLNCRIHLVPSLRMRGVIPLLPIHLHDLLLKSSTVFFFPYSLSEAGYLHLLCNDKYQLCWMNVSRLVPIAAPEYCDRDSFRNFVYLILYCLGTCSKEMYISGKEVPYVRGQHIWECVHLCSLLDSCSFRPVLFTTSLAGTCDSVGERQ